MNPASHRKGQQSSGRRGNPKKLRPKNRASSSRKKKPINENAIFAMVDRMFGDLGEKPPGRGRKVDHVGAFIELRFITPEIGERYADYIKDLAQTTGWDIRIKQTPNQQALKELAEEMVDGTMTVVKMPICDIENKVVRVQVASKKYSEPIELLFQEQTEYRLVIEEEGAR